LKVEEDMGAITRFEEIEAWQTARRLANLIYELTESNPFMMYLKSQSNTTRVREDQIEYTTGG
jgi:hypothetical protein